MKSRVVTIKKEAETNTQAEIENQKVPESTGSEYAAASLNRVAMPPGRPGANNLAGLNEKLQQPRCAHSQQLIHHLQRTHGNRYVQRVVELSRKGKEPAEVNQAIEQTIQSKRGGGQTLDSGLREKMEDGFGRDFSGVRVHTDSDADDLNKIYIKMQVTPRTAFANLHVIFSACNQHQALHLWP